MLTLVILALTRLLAIYARFVVRYIKRLDCTIYKNIPWAYGLYEA